MEREPCYTGIPTSSPSTSEIEFALLGEDGWAAYHSPLFESSHEAEESRVERD